MRILSILFSLILVVSLLGVGAAPAVAAGDEWQTHSTEHFNIYYKSGYAEDAQKIGNIAETTRKQLLQSVPKEISLSLSDKISIYVYPDASWDRSQYSLYWENTQPVKIHLLAPSDSPVDEGWYQHGIAAELGNIITWDVARDSTDYRFWSRNPGWFYEGLTEYYVYKTSSVADQFPPYELKRLNQTIREDEPEIQDIMDKRYYGGYILNMYLIDKYGEHVAWEILRSDEPSFDTALSKTIGITYTEFKQNWYEWANKHVGADYSITNSTTTNSTLGSNGESSAESQSAADNLSAPLKISLTASVYQNGTATITQSINRTMGDIMLDADQTALLSFLQGKDAVTQTDWGGYQWNTTKATHLKYRVLLGNASYASGQTENAILFRMEELMPFHSFAGKKYYGEDLVRTVTINPPSGWNAAVPGTKVDTNTYELKPGYIDNSTHLREELAVGDFTIHTWETRSGQTIRYVAFPSAEAPPIENIRETLKKGTTAFEQLTGSSLHYPILAMTVPADIGETDSARDHSFNVRGGKPVYDIDTGWSVYLHEYYHLFQHSYGMKGSGGDWINEGSAEYMATLALYKADLISESEFKHAIRVEVTRNTGIGQPVEATALQRKYKKGAAVWAALDMSIRYQTNGEKTVGDVVKWIQSNAISVESDEGQYITESEFESALKELTGNDYSHFIDTYVHSKTFPHVLMTERYSLTDPVPVLQNSTSTTQSPIFDSQVAQYDTDTSGTISIAELGHAASDYAKGKLSITALGKVASAFAAA